MKYLKLYEKFEIFYYNDDSSIIIQEMGYKEKMLRDICLELEDLGIDIRINIGRNNSFNDGVYKNIHISNFGYSKGDKYFPIITWPELREYLLRIKDFLGDDFKSFLFYNDGEWIKTHLNENSELDTKYLSVCIYYNKLQFKV